jgi:PBSX family phage terminase large subunit
MIKKRVKKVNDKFKFQPFSKKQNKILKWWEYPNYYDKYDIVIADGAIRAGKTIAMICSFLMWSQTYYKYHDFIIAGKSINTLKRNVIKPMRQIISAFNWTENYNRSSNYIELGTNTYYLYGANNEGSQDLLQGLTAAGALADEIALFPKSFTDQMIGRCSVEGSKIFCNCNPQSPYHYFKTEFIDMAVDKMIYYLHFTMNDNLTLSQRIKDRYKKMFTGMFFKRYILGLWVIAEGIIFDMFDEKKHVIDTSIYYDLIEEFNISIDYGVHNAFSAGLWGKIGEKHYRLKEYYYSGKDSGKQLDNEVYYKNIVELAGNRKIKNVVIDPSASSFIQTIKKYGKFYVLKAKNDVLEGIENMSTALNKDIIFIDNSCKDWIKEVHSYSWDKKAAERGEDKPTKLYDHCMDESRYYCNTLIFNKKVFGWKKKEKTNDRTRKRIKSAS